MIAQVLYQSRFYCWLEWLETSTDFSLECIVIQIKNRKQRTISNNFGNFYNLNKRYKQIMDSQQSGQKEINWHEYNYPPLIKLMHFRPSQIPQDRKSLIMILFAIHIIVLLNTLLSIVDNCMEGGLGILYAFLFFFIFNPIILFLFYRAHVGLCREKGKLGLYIYIQPLVIVVEVVISIVDFLGFNGFIRVANLFDEGEGLEGILGLVNSLVYLVVVALSCYCFLRICKERSTLTQALL